MAMAATAPAAACSCSLGRGRGDAKFNGLLTFVAVAKLGLHDRFGSADEASSSGRKLSVACSVAAEARHGSEEEEEQSLGDFCWLYSPLKMVGTASSRVPRRRGLTPKRKLQARAAVVGETRNGGLRDVVGGRWGSVVRETKETQVDVSINLDGTGICNCDTGIPFLDHMLDQLASHGLFDLDIKAKGDTHIDDHHTNEDVALALGSALLKALGDRKGITRFGNFSAPLDEALVRVVLDLSGRPFLRYEVDIPTQRVGTYDTQLVEHFFQSLANTSGMTLHIDKLAGKNSHHIIEATFKAFARALRQATEFDVRRQGTVPSSKGVLSRA